MQDLGRKEGKWRINEKVSTGLRTDRKRRERARGGVEEDEVKEEKLRMWGGNEEYLKEEEGSRNRSGEEEWRELHRCGERRGFKQRNYI